MKKVRCQLFSVRCLQGSIRGGAYNGSQFEIVYDPALHCGILALIIVSPYPRVCFTHLKDSRNRLRSLVSISLLYLLFISGFISSRR